MSTPKEVRRVSPVPPMVTGKGLGSVNPLEATSILIEFGPNTKVRLPPDEVIVPKAGSPPVAAKSIWPSVPGAVTSKLFCPSPMSTPKAVRSVSPVPPIFTGKGVGMVKPSMATSIFIEFGPKKKVNVPPDDVIVPKTGSAPEAAKSTWPSVPGSVTSTLFCPSPIKTPKDVNTVSPVPPYGTGRGLK